MGRATFENYGTRASLGLSPTETAGRHEMQIYAERRILADILGKLKPEPSNSLLEIGCGPGSLLIPLSFAVDRAVGIDHPDVIGKLNNRHSSPNIETIGGNFLDLEISEKFDRILIYSVLHCLKDSGEVFAFVSKAAALLGDHGRILIGDLPNLSLKQRAQSTPAGIEAEARWRLESATDANRFKDQIAPELKPDTELVQFDDQMLCELMVSLRSNSLEAYLLPQPELLPFGRTREDLLAVAKHRFTISP